MSHIPAESGPSIGRRKADHIALCAEQDVESRSTSTLLEQVTLMHDSLPELAADGIDMTTTLLGRKLPTPLMISGMTGGIDEAGRINRMLAAVAQRHGLAFGVGSQRPMMRDPSAVASFQVRDVAPDVFICGNIGAVQATQAGTAALADLVGAIDADALCIHLNPAQEMIQDEGDRDFRGCLDAIAEAAATLDVPVIAKETGCGMSASTARRLAAVGVRAVDVSGSGGTTWVGVEALRATGHARTVGEVLWDWGVPTAASIVFASRAGLQVIGSGGIRDGLGAARAIALGANVASAALPFLRAATSGGEAAADAVAETFLRTIRTAMLLTGSGTVPALQRTARRIGPELRSWLEMDAE